MNYAQNVVHSRLILMLVILQTEFFLIFQSTPLIMLDIAEYFEGGGALDKAVALFHKAGRLRRAIDLCFAEGLYDALQAIAEDLTAASDPALLARCSESLISNCPDILARILLQYCSSCSH